MWSNPTLMTIAAAAAVSALVNVILLVILASR
jgi:hypothetical protein